MHSEDSVNQFNINKKQFGPKLRGINAVVF
jgi:hypothetical protein